MSHLKCAGKLDKTDWQMQLLEKKIEENQQAGAFKDSHETKVPKWNKDAFTDKVFLNDGRKII